MSQRRSKKITRSRNRLGKKSGAGAGAGAIADKKLAGSPALMSSKNLSFLMAYLRQILKFQTSVNY